MSLEPELQALRRGVAWSRLDHVVALRLTGEGTYDALDAVCPAELYVRDGRMLHTLLLNPDGTPFSDLYVCRDDEEFILMSEGPNAAALIDYLEAHLPQAGRPQITCLDDDHELVAINGPFAWELLGELIGAEAYSLPYLSFFREEGITCFRAGKTGEYGYEFLVPRKESEQFEAWVQELGARLDLETAGLPALEQCALENWFFNIRREGRAGLTPVELQLQWRVSYRKTFVGREALKARLASPDRSRLTSVVGANAFEPGDEVRLDDQPIGRVVNAGFSPIRGDHVGLALLELRYAHSGIDRFSVGTKNGALSVRTVSPPMIRNRSLFVNPQIHSYRSVAESELPPLSG